MAMGDFTPWFNQASVQPQMATAPATMPSTGAQAVTNALTTPAATTLAATGPTRPPNPYRYDAWGQTPNQSFYGSNPGYWNFQGGGHSMGGGGGGGYGGGSGGSGNGGGM